MILFEHQNAVKYQESLLILENFLNDIWSKREVKFYSNKKSKKQRFIQINYKSNKIQSNNYVGQIKIQDQQIHLFPKIFYNANNINSFNTKAIYSHILWYLSYSKKFRFPNYKSSVSALKCNDFLEILIYLFSKYTKDLLSKCVYQQYEEVWQEHSFMRGRLNISEYVTKNIPNGNWHKLNCIYDEFTLDNKFNRIVKYVTSLLYNTTHDVSNKNMLREILFILDEVQNVKVSAEESANIQFNPAFQEFETVRDYCYLFLKNSVSFDYQNKLKLFAFLLPMEKVFEDFVFGFIEKELNIHSNSQIEYLDNNKIFRLKPDVILCINSQKIIADTKYKLLYSKSNDQPKISQSDLYQMTAYAVRYNISKIILFYPSAIHQKELVQKNILIEDKLANKIISVHVHQLPIINYGLFDKDIPDHYLEELFENTKVQLIRRFRETLAL